MRYFSKVLNEQQQVALFKIEFINFCMKSKLLSEYRTYRTIISD